MERKRHQNDNAASRVGERHGRHDWQQERLSRSGSNVRNEPVFRYAERNQADRCSSDRRDDVASQMEMSSVQNLSQSSLNQHSKEVSTMPYKERARLAIEAAGLTPPESFKLIPALSDPQHATEQKGPIFPLSDMIISKLAETWRGMAGLECPDEWNTSSDLPPPNPSKPNKSIPKPSVNPNDYGFPTNDFLCAKPLRTEVRCEGKSAVTVSIPRLQKWENTAATCLGILNMLNIFSTSQNKDMQKVWDWLETCTEDTVPPELSSLRKDLQRIKADEETRVKGYHHLASLLAWLLAENITVHRDHVLSTMPLSTLSKDVLRLQPLGGPFLFNGRLDEILLKDSVKINQQLNVKKKDGPTHTQSSARSFRGEPKRDFHSKRQRGQGHAQRVSGPDYSRQSSSSTK